MTVESSPDLTTPTPSHDFTAQQLRDAEAVTAASRRAFLVTTGAVAGATAVGAVAGRSLAGPFAQPVTDAVPGADALPVPAGDAIVVYLADVESGEFTLMTGDRQVTVVDHQLARELARKVR